MKAKDIMTSAVITVTPQAPLRQIVSLLLEHHVSGLLVVDNDEVVGTVGDGDLLHRYEIGTDKWQDYRTWWKRLTEADLAPTEYVKSHGQLAKDVMNRDVTSVMDDTPIAETAAIFESRQIRRIPVLSKAKLVGIITRADLVRALTDIADSMLPRAAVDQSDEAVRLQLIKELSTQPWWSNAWSAIFVQQGVVSFVGVFDRETDKEAARVAAINIPGVRGVRDRRTRYGNFQTMF